MNRQLSKRHRGAKKRKNVLSYLKNTKHGALSNNTMKQLAELWVIEDNIKKNIKKKMKANVNRQRI
jgi:hypothetical protein